MNWYEPHPAVLHIRDLHDQAALERLAAAARRGRSVGQPLPGELLDQRPSHRSIIASLILLGLGGVGSGADSRDGFGDSDR